MAVQYAPFPEFQVPNVNILGALAQGQASQLQEIQAAKAAQAMELAGQKDIREAAKYDMESKVKLQELNEKIRALAMSRLSAVPEGDQEGYLKTIGEFKDIFPSEYDVLSKRKWDADTRRMVLLTPEQQYKQTTKDVLLPSGETQTMRYPEFGGGAAAPIGGLVSAPKPELKEVGGELLSVTPQGAAPVPLLPVGGGRGQAGAFNAPTAAAPMNIIDQAKQGVARVESGGNYGAIGPDVKRKDGVDRAYGKYQVMGANIPSWTKQALGRSLTPQEFLNDKDAQEAVFEDQFKRNIAKYGSLEDAVSVWFSGRPLAQATKAGARDVNMGVQDYVGKVMSGAVGPYKASKTASLTGENPSLRNVPINAFTPEVAPANAFVAPMSPPAQPIATAAPLPEVPPMTVEQPLTVGTKTIVKGQTDVEKTLDRMSNLYTQLDASKAIPSEKRGMAENVPAYLAGTSFGQEVEKARATPAQTKRNELKSLTRALLNDIKKATGMSAQEINSNFELKNMLETLSDPTQSIESVRAILADLSSRYGRGKVAMPEEETPVAAPPAANEPRVIDFSQLPKRR